MNAKAISKIRDKKGRFLKGYSFSLKTQFKKGKPSPRKGIRKPGWTNQTSFKPRSSLWEKNVREYQSIHLWVKTNFGRPDFCEFCKKTQGKFEWANKTGRYIKDKLDWLRLCHICHRDYDLQRNGIKKAAKLILSIHYKQGLILIAGNGGSMEMSDHWAGELVGRFEKERDPIAAYALSSSAIITAISNDYGYEYSFSRQIEALGNRDGLFICLTTSDVNEKENHNLNLRKALNTAFNKKKMKIIILGSNKTKRLRKCANVFIRANGVTTAEIQNDQLRIMHDICREVEKAFI